MPTPLNFGDVVTVTFIGATGMKRRPAVIVSSDVYHQTRPDVIIGLLTTQVASATHPTDYLLQDTAIAGLRFPSAFRTYLNMVLPSELTVVGHLSSRDEKGVQASLALAFGLPVPP